MNLYQAEILAKKLMREHRLTLWLFEFTDWVKTFGMCQYSTRTIFLSMPLTLLNNENEVRDTILHEIAHALVGKGHGHNKTWKAKCIEIGAKPIRCYSNDMIIQPTMRYVATCDCCGKVYQRTRKPDSITAYACKCQKGPWNKRVKLIYENRFALNQK
mgnify:CR=1 FL=1